MRKLLVKDLHPGMITAEDIFSIDGQLILPKKIILTQNGIEKLEAFAIYSVRIEDEEVAPPQTSFFDTPSYSERIPILSILKKVLKIMWNPCRQD